MTQLYVKAWFLWVVVVLLLTVSTLGVSIYNNLNLEKEDHKQTKYQRNNLYSSLNETVKSLNEKTIENNNITFSLKKTKQHWNETIEDLNIIYKEKENLTKEVENLTLYNPTYDELLTFLYEDKTDENVYKDNYLDKNQTIIRDYKDYYVCLHFAYDLINNAIEKNIKCGHVDLTLRDFLLNYGFYCGDIYYPSYYNWYGHVMVAFNTTDEGIVFVEPQTDETFYNYFILKEDDNWGFDYYIYDLTITWLGK